MKLSIAERINVLGVLPAEGNIITLRIVNELRDNLSFREKEIADSQITQTEDGRITWDPTAAKDKDVQIGDAARDVIKAALKKLDEDKKLTPALVPIWDKFVAG